VQLGPSLHERHLCFCNDDPCDARRAHVA
jgi:hypothetical protein